MMEIEDEIKLDKNKKHDIDVVIDRIVIKEGVSARLSESLEAGLRLGEGQVIVDIIGEEELMFNEHQACPIRGLSISGLEPRLISFNAPHGTCETCHSYGHK